MDEITKIELSPAQFAQLAQALNMIYFKLADIEREVQELKPKE